MLIESLKRLLKFWLKRKTIVSALPNLNSLIYGTKCYPFHHHLTNFQINAFLQLSLSNLLHRTCTQRSKPWPMQALNMIHLIITCNRHYLQVFRPVIEQAQYTMDVVSFHSLSPIITDHYQINTVDRFIFKFYVFKEFTPNKANLIEILNGLYIIVLFICL